MKRTETPYALRREVDLSYEEAARICGTHLGTIKSRIRSGLRRLRADLAEAGLVEAET